MLNSQLPEYKVWTNMKSRCNNPNASQWEWYGGRGIKVCDRWSERRVGFDNFLADMGPRPGPKHSIDRIDTEKDYSPENCRWVTHKEQCANRRQTDKNSVFLEVDGVCKSMADWSRETGIKLQTLHSRVRYGWPPEQVIGIQPPRRTRRLIQWEGREVTLSELARLTGISQPVLRQRIIHLDWPVEQAVNTPVRKIKHD